MSERLARLYQLRERLEQEIAAEEALARQSPRRTKKRPRSVIPPCGTESAYQRHRHYGQKLTPGTDDCGCLAAHAAHNRELDRQRRLRINRALLGIAS
jgi:hypothetical protein